MIVLYSLAFLSLLIGMGAIFTLIEQFPVKLLYYHYHFRKPLIWSLFILSWVYQFLSFPEGFQLGFIPPLIIIGLSVVLTYKVHQSNWFKAIDYPKMTTDYNSLPLSDELELALIEYNGVTKAYVLNFVIHHHVINDKFNDKIVALTYCAMCRSIIPFDVTEIGPLFVASFKNANMIVADRKTGTFFQQATFNSIIGQIHPNTLEMIPFQVLPWSSVKNLKDSPPITIVTKEDLKPFNLPMPGVWNKVQTSELTPGLSNKDKTFPSKSHIIGIIDSKVKERIFYLKSQVLDKGIVKNDELNFTLISIGSTVVGFISEKLDLSRNNDDLIEDRITKTTWDATGEYMEGEIKTHLEPIVIADEFWFSWKKFHPNSKLIQLNK